MKYDAESWAASVRQQKHNYHLKFSTHPWNIRNVLNFSVLWSLKLSIFLTFILRFRRKRIQFSPSTFVLKSTLSLISIEIERNDFVIVSKYLVFSSSRLKIRSYATLEICFRFRQIKLTEECVASKGSTSHSLICYSIFIFGFANCLFSIANKYCINFYDPLLALLSSASGFVGWF